MTPRSPILLILGVAVSLVIVAAILQAHLGEVPAPRMGRYPVADPDTVLHVPAESPCTVDRVQLACDRWGSHGWPRCVAQPTGGRVEVVTYGGEERGAAAPGHIGIRPDSCGTLDPTIEHEIGHRLYDLAHVQLTGSVMCSHAQVDGEHAPERPDCAGLRMPRRAP